MKLLAAADLQGIAVDAESFLIIVVVSAVAGTIAAIAAGRNLLIPAVVVELALGILIGPELLDLAQVDDFTQFFSNLGLGMLFFFAGYEIDVRRIRGQPLRLAAIGWGLSLGLAYGVGGILAAAGIVLSLVYTGSAMATTAIGTLIPILRDSGELKTRFGTFLLAAGAVGEFGPIMLLTLALSSQAPLHEALILAGFVTLAVVVALLAVRSSSRSIPLIEATLEKSSQLGVRWTVVLVFALVLIANDLGLDLLLGGFAAGLIAREMMRERDVEVFDSKLTAVAFGFFVPFFFVVSGMALDVASLFSSFGDMLELPLFLLMFLLIRGLPALLLYRAVLPDLRDRLSLAFFSATQLPLVLAITTVATETGHMRTDTAAALISAAALSTLMFPLLGLKLRRDPAAPSPA